MTIKMKGAELVFAKPADEAVVKSLLAECGLPFEDISEHLIHFIVAKSKSVLVGVVGLEALGSVGLLRSVAVREPYRGKGLGRTLCDKMEGYGAS
jgi:amino-acid N-acetyltransferase